MGIALQVVQFLYEAGYGQLGKIGITEPRRIAAISTSKRVAFETGLGPKIVSYQVTLSGSNHPTTFRLNSIECEVRKFTD